MKKGFAVLCLAEVGGRTFRTFWSRVGELIAGIHVTAVVIFKKNDMLITEGSSKCRTHTDIHTAVSTYHKKGDFTLRIFTPSF